MAYRNIDSISKRIRQEKEKTISNAFFNVKTPGGIKEFALKPRFKKQHLQKLSSAYLMMLMIFQSLAGVFVSFSLPVQASSSWLSGYSYRTPVTVDNNNETDLTDYQTKIILQGSDSTSPNYIDFDKILPGGADLRITDSDQVTPVSYWIEEWNDTNKTATVWAKIPRIPVTSQTTPYFLFTVSDTNHNDYGLSYPVTYEFNIPQNSSNLRAYKKYNKDGDWTQMEEKTANDFFNGIEAVRFDYQNNKAYLSAAFDADSNDLYLKITDTNNTQVGIYQKIDKYYDNRKAAVTSSGDDWTVTNATTFETACDMFTAKHIWFTPAIITAMVSSTYWSTIQSKIDAGYIEPASHTRIHQQTAYTDTVSEVDGSKQDIINNLNLPAFSKKGSTEYLYSFIEPGGYSDSTIRQQLGISKYLVDRDVSTDSSFALWDYANGIYNRIGYSVRMGMDGITNLATLNNTFDSVYANGGIYHLMTHPPYVDWSSGAYADQHTTYISGKKDVWYAGMGYLYLYNYTREKAVERLAFSGVNLYLYYGKSGGTTTSNYDTTFTKDYDDTGLISLWHMDETPGSELLTDGNLETWTNSTTLTNWINDSGVSAGIRGVAQETANKQSGSSALKLSATGSDGVVDFGVGQDIATVSGQAYQVNFYQYYANRSDGVLKVEAWDNTNSVSLGYQIASAQNAAYSYASFRFVSTNTSSVKIKVYLINETTGTAYVDSLSVKQSPSTLTDSSGNNNTGTIYGASRTDIDGGRWGSRNDVTFSQGSSLQLDGVDDYVDAGNGASLNRTGPFTVEAWVKSNIVTGTGTIINKAGSTGSTGSGFYLSRYTQYFEFCVYDGVGNQKRFYSTTPILLGKEYHVVAVYNGSKMIVYVNGIESDYLDNVSGFTPATTRNLMIGKLSYTNSWYFDGTIDDARMYNRALSENEIMAHYQRRQYAFTVSSPSLSTLQTPSTYYTNTSNIISSSNNYLTYSTEPTPGNEITSSLILTPVSGYLTLDLNSTTASINYQNSTFLNLTANNIDRPTTFHHNNTSSLTVSPSSGTINLNIDTWNTTNTYYKKWTEDSTNHNITTLHTVGDLSPHASYILKIDGQETNTYDADNNGQITFTYQGGYSTHTFEIEQKPSNTFIPPTKPSVSNINVTSDATCSISLTNLPSNITQIAVSANKDFTNVSWEDITKKEELLKQYANQKEIYIKLRTDTGAVSDTITYTPPQTSNTTIQDGDIVKTPDSPDIYVIKTTNNKKYKRLILSPNVFNSYHHLKWENIKTITEEELNQYQTSNLVKELSDTIVYTLIPSGDTGKRKPFDLANTYDPDSIYTINKVDRDSYEWEE